MKTLLERIDECLSPRAEPWPQTNQLQDLNQVRITLESTGQELNLMDWQDYLQHKVGMTKSLLARAKKQIETIRVAFAEYTRTEGCGCCERRDEHEVAARRLAELMEVPPYDDGSGYDFGKFEEARDVR